MILAALMCAAGLVAGLLLIGRVPVCDAALRAGFERVSVIIPARNEAQNLPRLLQSLNNAQPRPTEVIVVDDGSTDGTAAIASEMGARVLIAQQKPAEWTGKSWACAQGAQHSSGDLLLFLDADTWFQPGGYARVVSTWEAQNNPRTVLSVLPFHAMQTAGERLSLFFNLLMAAGAGGFGPLVQPQLFGQSMLMARSTYFHNGGHGAVPGVVLENLRLARTLRAAGCSLRSVSGYGALHMRMFPQGFSQMTESWSKAFLQGAADSGAAIVLGSVVWISALWSIVMVLLMPHNPVRIAWLLAYVVVAAQLAWSARRLGNYNLLVCLLYPFPLAYYCAVFARAALYRALGRKAVWKGREV